MLTLAPSTDGYEVLNVSPPDYLDAAYLGRIFGKRIMVLPPALLKTLFWLTWHGTRGALTTRCACIGSQEGSYSLGVSVQRSIFV